jgi:glycosyltransferase involved in cell wall biosynthesis
LSEALAPARAQEAAPQAALRRVAVVPAFNEAECIGRVIDELRGFDRGFDVVVIDDGSTDGTSAAAAARGAIVIRLPFNLGIGGAVQTGFRYALEHGYELAVRVDGDGQHDARQLDRLLRPVLDGEADIAVGSRFAGASGYRVPLARRVGIRLFAGVLSLLVRQRVTDPTSGFQALSRRAIALFAADYPHDYPEVEATVMVFKHRLRLTEVPVTMRQRAAGASSITVLRSIYYMIKVLLAVFVAIFRRRAVPLEDENT